MAEFPFSQIQVDELARAPKYIPSIPQMKTYNGSHTIAAPIFLEKECKKQIHLRIFAQLSINSISQPVQRPSCSLLWFNQRIRGLNWHLRKRNPDGTEINEWHEHIWKDEHGDLYVIPVTLDSPTIGALLAFCLERWNIMVIGSVEPLLFGG